MTLFGRFHCGRLGSKPITKRDLLEMEKRIMATSAELTADLKEASARQKQTLIDIASVQTNVDSLKAKIVELEALIAAGGAIGQELVDAVAEVKSLAQQADDSIPNPTPPTEPPLPPSERLR